MRISLPEQTWIDIRPAHIGSRASAFICDWIIRFLALLLGGSLLLLGLNMLFRSSYLSRDLLESIASLNFDGTTLKIIWAVLLFIYAFMEIGYAVYFEVRHNGITPGKRMFGLQVVDERGLPISYRASFIRNIFLLIEYTMTIGLLPIISIFLTKKSQRLGDLVAGTMVIYTDPDEALQSEPSQSKASIYMPLEAYRILQSYLQRRHELAEPAYSSTRNTLFKTLQKYRSQLEFRSTINDGAAVDEWLFALHQAAIPGRQSSTTSQPDQLIDWNVVRAELSRAERDINALSEDKKIAATKLFGITETYQLLCQRYAYLSEFYPRTLETAQAARLVREGRKLIYGKRLAKRLTNNTTFLQRAHQGFLKLRPYCALAAAIAVVSAGLASLMIEINPQTGWYFLSEQTAAQLSEGRLWTESIRGMSEVSSSSIMSNNIKVSFMAFAFGITGGVGTVLVLISNGALLGGIFTVLAKYDMAFRLFDFVCAHGFLELSVIAVAAGCGLALGDSLLQPGALTRIESIKLCARSAIDLLLFSALCLIPAGIVEGFVSPYAEIPFSIKLALGLILGLLYWTLLLTGTFNTLKIFNSKPTRKF